VQDRDGASVLTIALGALAGIVSVAGLISPAVLGALERTPAALHGEAWRRAGSRRCWAGTAVALWLGALLATW
jgi:hypothetical protein